MKMDLHKNPKTNLGHSHEQVHIWSSSLQYCEEKNIVSRVYDKSFVLYSISVDDRFHSQLEISTHSYLITTVIRNFKSTL